MEIKMLQKSLEMKNVIKINETVEDQNVFKTKSSNT